MKSLYYRQILFIILVFFAFLLIIAALIFSGSASAASDSSRAYNQQDRKKELKRYNNSTAIISRDERIDADIMIIDGTISIDGKINGDVVAIWSEVRIKSRGEIFGNLISFHSEITKEDDARIGGDLIVARSHKITTTKYGELDGYHFPYHLFANSTSEEEEKYVEIGQDETITGDVIVLDKELRMNGRIAGDLICLTGKIVISETGVIDGHLMNYDGTLDISDKALVTGDRFDNSTPPAVVVQERDEIDDHKVQEDIEEKYLKRRSHKSSDVIRFFGNVVIDEDEEINGDVVIMRGTAQVKGEVNGEVVAIWGDVEIDSTGYISGDVVSVGGKIYRKQGSFVGGDVVQTSWTGVKVNAEERGERDSRSTVRTRSKKDNDWERLKSRTIRYEDEFDTENFMFRYNRVEGLFLGVRLPKYGFDTAKMFQTTIYGHAGYGFQNKRGRYQAGLERRFFYTTIGGEAHDVTDTEDDWLISSFENSLAAFFLKEDFHDYYRRLGASGYLTQNITPQFAITVGYHKNKFYNMKKETNWALFGGKKNFLENPSIYEIDIRHLKVDVSLDTRNSHKYPTQGWYINLAGEFAGLDFNKNGVDFNRFIFDVRRYQPIGHGENLDFRLRCGTARGELPVQFRYDLGGLSTLRGYHFKEFQNGDRMILGNIEYRLYGPEFNFRELDLLHDINLILFADAGYVWNASDNTAPEKSFKHLTWDHLKTDVGVGLSNYEGNMRIEFAKRLDHREKPAVITVRLRRPF